MAYDFKANAFDRLPHRAAASGSCNARLAWTLGEQPFKLSFYMRLIVHRRHGLYGSSLMQVTKTSACIRMISYADRWKLQNPWQFSQLMLN